MKTLREREIEKTMRSTRLRATKELKPHEEGFDLWAVQQRDRWSGGSCYLKRSVNGKHLHDWNQFGMLIAQMDNYTVYPVRKPGEAPTLEEQIEYESAQALIDDGWFVD